MKKIFNHENRQTLAFAIISGVLLATIIYSVIRMNSLSEKVLFLTTNLEVVSMKLASTTDDLNTAISQTHSSLSKAITNEQQNVGAIRQQLGTFQNQVGNISGTVNTLQKLSKTDPELLKKYSKVYFLNENYVPARLTEIPNAYQYSDRKKILIHSDVWPQLKNMIDAASSTNVTIYAFSGYRSFDEQRALKTDYRMTYGAGTANTFSADQGYSEHQLGTALDFITPGLGGVLDGFDGTQAYEWMLQNGYKYGFILSYPKKNDYYVFEPWHWRFVGVKLAKYLHDNKKNFYDMDQREIDEYLVTIFD